MNTPARRVALALVMTLLVVGAAAPAAAQAVFINEIHYDNTGTDAGEAIEVAGPAGTNLSGWTLVLYNGTGGVVYNTTNLSGTIPNQGGTGYGTLSFSYPVNGIQNGSPDGMALANGTTLVQFLCYEGTFAAVGGVADGVTCTDIGVFEAGTEAVGQSLRLSGSGSTYTDFSWNAPATASFGSINTGQTFVSPDPKINEFSANTAGTDVEYVEIFGLPNTDFSGLRILEIEGDAGTAVGTIDEVVTVGTTNASGFWLGSLAANALENGTITLLLVEGFSGGLGDDLDTDNDGVLDTTPWTRIVDAVATNDGGAGDRTYGVPALGVAYDGLPFSPGGASRIPDGTDTDTAADWVRNDYDLAGIPGFAGTPIFHEAYNTPGATNQAVPSELAPTVVSTSPANGAVGVSSEASPTVTFSELVNVAAGAFTLACPVGTPFTVTVTGGPTTFTLDPTVSLPASTTCTATVLSASVTDQDADDPPDNMAVDFVWTFTTGAAPIAIHTIQGAGISSPLVGNVVTTRGIVTGVKYNAGFFIQEPDATVDANPLTSEGILVYTGASIPPAAVVGNLVEVSGTVVEYVPAADPNQRPLTELGAPLSYSVLSAGNALPAPIPLSASFPDPAGSYDQLEPLEGMRVSVASFTVTAPTTGSTNEPNATGSSYGEFFGVVTGVAKPFREAGIEQPNPPPVGTTIPPLPRWDANPELLRVDSDGQVGALQLNTPSGTVLTGLVGPLDYAYRRYSVLPDPSTPPAVVPGMTAVAVSTPLDSEFTVASYNLERFFDSSAGGDAVLTPTAYANRLKKASLQIRNFLKTPDVLGVSEVENLSTLQALATQISTDAIAAAQPDPLYAAFLVEGNDVGGIDVGFLVKTAPVVGATPRVTVNAVVQERAGTLFVNDDSSTELLNDRPPLRLDAIVNHANGSTFPVTVIVNHLRSLNGVDSDAPGSLGWTTVGERVRAKRLAQALDLADLVQDRQLANPAERIVLVGDFNAFDVNDGLGHSMSTIAGETFSDDTTAVPADGTDTVSPDLVNLISTAPASERYSFVYEGTLQSLDHVLVNDDVVAGTLARRLEHPRINADFPETDRSLYGPADVTRLADHDPLVGFFQVAAFASADLAVTKTDTPDPAVAGTNLAYTITVVNVGPDAAATASFTDTLPAGTTFVSLSSPGGWSCTTPAVGVTGTVSCSIPSLAVGSADFTLTVAVDPGVPAGTVLSNTATASATTVDSNPENNGATATTTVAAQADVSVTKIDTPDPVNAGTNLTYTLSVANAGPSGAASVSLSDTLPAGTTFVSLASPAGWSCTTPAVGGTGTVSCTAALLAVGSADFTLTVAVNPGVPAGTVLSNTATASAATTDADPGNNTATATTTVAAQADVSITKIDTPDPVNAGTNLTYTLSVANAGPSEAATVSLSDTLPAGTTFVSFVPPAGWSCTTPAVGVTGTVSCSIPSLAVGSANFTLSVAVDPGVPAGTVLSNTATASAATADDNPVNNSATATTTVAAQADVSVTKIDTPDPVNAGTNLAYTLSVANAGPSEAASGSLSDTLPAGTTFVSLASPAGWSCTTPAVGGTGTVSCTAPLLAVGSANFTLTVAVDPGVPAGTVLSNTATASAATTDPAPANNSATATTTVAAQADVSVVLTGAPDPVVAGSNLTYTATVSNSGPSTATTVALSDTLPAGTTFVSLSAPAGWICTTPAAGSGGSISCTVGTLPVGSAVFTLIVAVDPAVANGTTIANTAITSAATADPNPANDSSTTTSSVSIQAGVSITLSGAPEPVVAGTNLTYTSTVTNLGPSAASTLTWSDTLPAGTTFVSLASPGGWACTTPAVGGTGTASCSLATLPVGTATFTLVVAVGPAVPGGTVLSDTATTTSLTAEGNTATATATATNTVSAQADLAVTLVDAPDPVVAGTNLTYTSTLTNNGPSAAATVTFSDTLPAGTTFVSLASPAGFTCSTPAVGAAGTVSCSNASFAVGSGAFTLVVAVGPGATGGSTVSNTATVASATTDSNPANNTATASTTVSAEADLSITLADAPDPVTAGTDLTYSATLANNGPSAATTVSFTNTLPAGTTFVSLASPAAFACTTPAVGAAGTVTCTTSTLAQGATGSFTLVVDTAASLAGGSTITNTATVAAATTDPASANDSATATTTVSASSGVSIGVVASPEPVVPGGTLTWTVTLSNLGPSETANLTWSDPLPAGTTFTSLAAEAGWTCSTPTAGTNGTVSCSIAPFPVGTATFTITGAVDGSTLPGTVLSNTASITVVSADTDPGDNTSTSTTNVLSPAALAATKTASGSLIPGGTVTYTIVLQNSAATVQADNPGDELTDVLPAPLVLVSASATSGTAVATVATNTVTWNGTIPAGGTVTVTITAAIPRNAVTGSTISNQATISYDADGDGTNETSGVSDDPATGTVGDPTGFAVGAAGAAVIPALDGFGLGLLALLVALGGALVLGRRLS